MRLAVNPSARPTHRAPRTGLGRMLSRDTATTVFGGADRAGFLLLQALWPRVVGPELARRSEVVALERGVLRVRVADAAWRKTLFRMQREILVRFYRACGELAPGRLGFLEGPILSAEAQVPAPPPLEPVRSDVLTAAAAAIADPEMRAAFLDTAGRYLARQQRDARSEPALPRS